MEAEDTVMGKVQRDNIFYCGIGTLKGLCKVQAEITWDIAERAGMKKVVDWIDEHGGSLDGFRTEWQAQLKDWHIND